MPKLAPTVDQARSCAAATLQEVCIVGTASRGAPISRPPAGIWAQILFACVVLGCGGCAKAVDPDVSESDGRGTVDQVASTTLPDWPEDLKVTLISDSSRPPAKRQLELMLSRKVSHAELEAVALQIHARASAGFDRDFLLFEILEQKEAEGSWALAEFTPGMKLTFFGATLDLEARARSIKPVGVWIDDRTIPTRTLSLLIRGGEARMRERFADGTAIEALLEETGHPDGRCFRERESDRPTDFVLRPDGTLGVRRGESTSVSLKPVSSEEVIVGQWVQNSSPGRVLTLIEFYGKLRLLQQFNDGSDLEVEVTTTDRPNGRHLRARSRHEGDYYVICPNGELESCDEQGVIVRLSRFE